MRSDLRRARDGNFDRRSETTFGPRTKSGGSGFTLLEVLMTLAILALTLVVLLGMRNRDVELVEATRSMTVATALARTVMEESDLSGFPELGETAGGFGEDYPQFRWRRVVSPTPFDYVREVRILVVWSDRDADLVELVNYVFEEENKGRE